jgi:hypothetical protein
MFSRKNKIWQKEKIKRESLQRKPMGQWLGKSGGKLKCQPHPRCLHE